MHQPRLPLHCGQASSHMSSLFISILGTRSLILQSIWALSHALSYLAKGHCTPRKRSFILAPTLSWCGAESLRSKPAEHQPWKCFLKSLPAKLISWLWHTLGPGDTGLTGEIIMFYPSLTPLSVTRMRTDKCSDGRTHSCSIYSWSLVPAGSPIPGTIPGDQPTPRYLLPANTCCPLVKCQAALSLLHPQSCQLLQELRHHCLSDDLHMKGNCLHTTHPPACSAPGPWPGPLCKMSVSRAPKPIALVKWRKEVRKKSRRGAWSLRDRAFEIFQYELTFHYSFIQQTFIPDLPCSGYSCRYCRHGNTQHSPSLGVHRTDLLVDT